MYEKAEINNQTVFSQVEPILDDSLEKKMAIKRKLELEALGVKPWFKRPKVLLILGLVVVLLLLVVALKTSKPENQAKVLTESLITPTPEIMNLDLPGQIEQEREKLKRLEFQDDALAFPQIDKKIQIKVKP